MELTSFITVLVCFQSLVHFYAFPKFEGGVGNVWDQWSFCAWAESVLNYIESWGFCSFMKARYCILLANLAWNWSPTWYMLGIGVTRFVLCWFDCNPFSCVHKVWEWNGKWLNIIGLLITGSIPTLRMTCCCYAYISLGACALASWRSTERNRLNAEISVKTMSWGILKWSFLWHLSNCGIS